MKFASRTMLPLSIIFILCLFGSAAKAQAPERTLRVATRLVKPFVYQDNGRLTGFSIELWQEIATQLGVKTEFVIKPTVQELLAGVDGRDAAVGISAISITAEREIKWDFSQPMFESGLQILIGAQDSQSGAIVSAILAGALSSATWSILGMVALIVLIPAHLVWFFERRNSTGMLAHREYFPGIFEACWWAAATLATQADQMPRAAFARIVAVIWMFTSVVFIAYFTAAVTSSLTVQQLRGDINGPEDLPGKRVASVQGSTSEEFLRQRKIDVTPYVTVEEAYDALQQKQLDAIVYDAPVLLYYASHEGKGKVQTIGPIFRKENYGVVFPDKSPLRKPVNEALLKIRENGTYDRLYAKWFSAGAPQP